MDRYARLAAIRAVFRTHRAVTCEQLAETLECSIPTAKRTIREARATLDMPIRWDAGLRAYTVAADEAADREEIPGLWLTGPELGGLVTLQTCLTALAPEPIGPLLVPVGRKLAAVMARSGLPFEEVQRRVRIVPQHARQARPDWITLTEALLKRRRVAFTYDGRSNPRPVDRVVSPQRLVLYRGSWYLDGWCHLRDAIRSFAVERIRGPKRLPDRARDVDAQELDRVLGASYGIFAGIATDIARLRFTAFAARWVTDESWHPRQTTVAHADGGVEIAFPIGRREELVLDVLRWGPEVEVIAPADLRAEVAARLRRAAARYETGTGGSRSDPPAS